jgi:hypothetical protein
MKRNRFTEEQIAYALSIWSCTKSMLSGFRGNVRDETPSGLRLMAKAPPGSPHFSPPITPKMAKILTSEPSTTTAPHLAMRGRCRACARCHLGWLMEYETAT